MTGFVSHPYPASKLVWEYLKDTGDLIIDSEGLQSYMIFLWKMMKAIDDIVAGYDGKGYPPDFTENAVCAWLVNDYLPPIRSEWQRTFNAKK
jgi:hypothetical protein